MRNSNRLRVSETFYSIQGESSFAGSPCLFIRLAGCNLRCSYCDARYTYEEAATTCTIAELLRQAAAHPGVIVEVTGGEPLLQEEVYPLLEGLVADGRTVLLETNGSLPLDRVPPQVVTIMDLKCPDSGMHERMELTNLDRLRGHDEVKFVVSSRRDYDWALAMIDRYRLADRVKLILSPVVARLSPARLADWMLADHLPARLQLQLHTLLWPDRSRGA